MRTSQAVALIACMAVLSACDDSPGPAVDAAAMDAPVDVAIDAISIDANCPARTPGQVGGACVTDANCDTAAGAADGICLRGVSGSAVWPEQGFCITKYDDCTVDAECGANNLCATINDPLGAFRVCLPACGTGACACSNGQLCAPSFAGSVIQNGDLACLPGNAAATDGDACVGFGECPQDSLCLDDTLEYPGGQCHTVACTIGNDTTCAPGGDGHCVDRGAITTGLNTGAVCVDRCAADTDCRQADGYRCFDGGVAMGRYCRHPQAGDACAVDPDCGNAALWDCKIGVTFPGGMCTPTTGCPTPGSGQGCSPTSSVCYDSVLPVVATDNVCANRCGGPIGTQGGCRIGYVCRDTNPGVAVALGCVNP